MDRSDGWFLAVVGVAIGFICGIAWVDFGQPWAWVSTYQTLITGLLAVAAAFITVNAMTRSEERQQQRHDQLMRLNLRADRLRARRAAFPYADMIKVNSERLQKEIDDFRLLLSEKGDCRSAMGAVVETKRQIYSIICNEYIDGAADMFGSDMSYTFQRIKMVLAIDISVDSSVNAFVGGVEFFPNDHFETNCMSYILNCEFAYRLSHDFSVHLIKLASYYGK